MMTLAPTAHAQDAAALADVLTADVRCQDTRTITDLSANVSESGGTDQAMLLEALTLIGADEAACIQVREAARSLAADLAPSVNPEAGVKIAARAVVDATLAEADRRSASMKFEVGPPPLNLSRGRKGGS
ncbi:MAG: hypothetical protein B7Z38_00855 [Rhodobacterales bacterium 12-64-8]|nr:MAG: hypothetical protein B7Z38_00855 [Rhodobacterales bacterium 12-64-8]OYX50751.1 MAG: hypothetical protein B7Y90_02815 [Alphaproteobacteria bacterium 32-64-14]